MSPRDREAPAPFAGVQTKGACSLEHALLPYVPSSI